jgi:hypothetical protein
LASAPSVRAIDWLEGAKLFGFVRTRIWVFSPHGFSLGSKNFEINALDDLTSGPLELAKEKCTINRLYDPSGTTFDHTRHRQPQK